MNSRELNEGWLVISFRLPGGENKKEGYDLEILQCCIVDRIWLLEVRIIKKRRPSVSSPA